MYTDRERAVLQTKTWDEKCWDTPHAAAADVTHCEDSLPTLPVSLDNRLVAASSFCEATTAQHSTARELSLEGLLDSLQQRASCKRVVCAAASRACIHSICQICSGSARTRLTCRGLSHNPDSS